MKATENPRLTRRATLAAAAALALPSRARAEPARPIEVIHWWTGSSESAAIRVIRQRLEAQGKTWRDTTVEGPDIAKTLAMTRVLGGQPPTVMLWFVGPDLAQLYRDGVIRDVQAVAEAGGWDAVLPEGISRNMKVDGKYVAVPADLHSSNWTFANASLLRRAGVEMPTRWDEVLQACPKLRDAGAIPIAFGGQPWQEASVFVMLIAGIGGADLLRRVITDHDPDAAAGATMVETFATFARLKPFTDLASRNRSWTDTANLLVTNRAALFFCGDWARGDLTRAGMRAETDFLCRPAPGTDGLFLATVDAFVMPAVDDPAIRADQDDFARATMDIQVQHDLNLVKGSIPPRRDVPLAGYDPCARMAASVSRDGQVLTSSSMGMTTEMRQAMYDVVHRFWNTEDADPQAAARDLRIAIERTRL